VFDPFEEIRRLQDRFYRLVEEFERRIPEFREFKLSMPVDVIDEEEEMRIVADLPGFKKEDIEVYFEGDSLVIKAERKEEEEERKREYVKKERRYGMFFRRISVPSEVDKDNVKAKYNNGVLEITIPKVIKEKKTIKIE